MKGLVPFGLLVVVFSASVSAQAMMVIGGASIARECYQASVSASMTGSANRMDIEVCDRAVADGGLKKRDLVATYVNRGVISVAMERYADAARDYNKALELDPQQAEAYVNRGNLLFMANRYTEAIADYDRSLELGFGQPHIALLNRGMVFEASGQLLLAKKDYLAALKLVDEWPVALQKLERLNRKLK